jgi:hypothetical protein
MDMDTGMGTDNALELSLIWTLKPGMDILLALHCHQGHHLKR